MPVQPKDRLTLMREMHVYEPLTRRQQQVWGGLVVGMTDEEIATALKRSQETVRNHLTELQHRLFDESEIAASRSAAVALFWLHTECCTERLLKLVESGGILGRDARA